MNKIGKTLGAAFALGFALSARQGADAQDLDIYKCIGKDGRVTYTSNPPEPGDGCRLERFQIVEPNPDEVARQLEETRRLEEQLARAAEDARREREVRAKEREAAAAERNARAAERAASRPADSGGYLRQRPVYGPYNPYYYGGGGIARPYPYPVAPPVAIPPPTTNYPAPVPPSFPPTGAVRKN